MTGRVPLVLPSLSAELLKLRRRPAVWVIGGVLVSSVLVFGYLFIYVFFGLLGDELGQVGFEGTDVLATLLPANVPAMTVGYANSFGGPAALVLGVLVAGSEYGWRTVRTIVTQRPGRLAILAGKLAAVVLLALLGALVLLLLALASSFVIAAIEGALDQGGPALGDLAVAAGASSLVFAVWASLGVFLGVLLRGTGLAIGLGLVYAMVLEGIVAALPIRGAVTDALRQVLIGTNGAALSGALGSTLDEAMAMGGPPIEPVQALAVLLVYTAAFAGAAMLVFTRREIA